MKRKIGGIEIDELDIVGNAYICPFHKRLSGDPLTAAAPDMLEVLIMCYNDRNGMPVSGLSIKLKSIIERATGQPIEEVIG